MKSRPNPGGQTSDLAFALWLTLPVLLFLCLVVLYPLLYAAWMSLNRIEFLGRTLWTFVALENYRRVFADPAFFRGLLISMRFTVESVILTLGLGLAFACALNSVRGSGFLRGIVIIPWALSPYAVGVLFQYLGAGQTGIGTALVNSLGSDRSVNLITRDWVVEYLSIGNAWNLAPLVTFFLVASMTTIPRRLYDLARIDGLTPFQTFLTVTLPPLKFTLFVFGSIVTVLSLKNFDFIFTLGRGGPANASATLTYEVFKTSFQELDLGYGAAMSFCLLALVIGSTMALQWTVGRRVNG
ncbi:sugar ABC transporter permease [Mesorhizobium sp. M3A.F.Ca.ET.201.01.1.1]|uniref:carbohydrate ABC transporter permease n=1 Tax=Mesorhizobium sp. M3A.F.Ca.ET.201.01.1.1 TaxID=2563946 RepID=UPI001675DB2B|nr:sugar ABC transporter permease [Mesorhizobium sp. M3A.F.Ca.ET.201.01.1.1]